MNVQILEKGGVPEYAVIPYADFGVPGTRVPRVPGTHYLSRRLGAKYH